MELLSDAERAAMRQIHENLWDAVNRYAVLCASADDSKRIYGSPEREAAVRAVERAASAYFDAGFERGRGVS